MDASVVAIVVFVILVIVLWIENRRGRLGNFSGGAGNALCQLHSFLRPTMHNIVEARKQRKKDAAQGDDGPPELPPWAQSGE